MDSKEAVAAIQDYYSSNFSDLSPYEQTAFDIVLGICEIATRECKDCKCYHPNEKYAFGVCWLNEGELYNPDYAGCSDWMRKEED